MYYALLIFSLVFTFLALSASISAAHAIFALFVAVGIVLLIRPDPRPVRWHRFPLAVWALVKYVAVLALNLAGSGIQVALIVLNPSLPIRQGIVRIPSGYSSEMETALSAHAITLTPGEMVIEIDDQGNMYTHCLLADESEKNAADQQTRRRKLLDAILQ